MRSSFLRLYRKYNLYALVFVTGSIVLIIEVIAVRILAPYFGNTLFSISSVLSVVLLALSVGYWYGGILADKGVTRSIFYTLIVASGSVLLMIEVVRLSVLDYISKVFSIVSGPLVASVLLFILPSFLLGMLSPLAIKLKVQEDKKMGIGRVTGGMFFWSTVGSILGSLLAGFVLIPLFGIHAIIVGTGVVLLLIGGIPVLVTTTTSSRHMLLVTTLAALTVLGVQSGSAALGDTVVYRDDGLYGQITILKSERDGRVAHHLLIDNELSGAAYDDSNDMVYDYTKYFQLYKAYGLQSIGRSLNIGGGPYTIPRALLNEPGDGVVDVVEIEPRLIDLAHRYFGLPYSDRLQNHIDDGRRYLARNDQKYDYIFADVYKSLVSIPSHFTTNEFFELAKSRLNENGLFMSNVIGDLYRGQSSFTLSQIRTFREVFPNSRFYLVNGINEAETQNIIMIGGHGDAPQTVDYKQLEGTPIADAQTHELDVDRFNLSLYKTFTDDYSPTDHLVAGMIQRDYGERPSSGAEAMGIIRQLLSYGSRHPGSIGGDKTARFIQAELSAYADLTSRQDWEESGIEYTNVIGKFRPDLTKRVLLGTHYDNRVLTGNNGEHAYIPGANDSASGVAALLVLASKLGGDGDNWPYDFGVDIVFFDGEEGPMNDEAWRPIGAEFFASNISEYYSSDKPEAGIIFDMVCENNAKMLKEPNSLLFAPNVLDAFWSAGAQVSPQMFPDQTYGNIGDDHVPLSRAGIPSILVIDPNYSAFHTAFDTLDKCSPLTLGLMIKTTLLYLQEH